MMSYGLRFLNKNRETLQNTVADLLLKMTSFEDNR